MYAGIAITTLAVAITITRLVKDVLLVRLIKGLTRENALSQKQRFELCARLTSALGSDGQPSPRLPGCAATAHRVLITTTAGQSQGCRRQPDAAPLNRSAAVTASSPPMA